jgi:hypothetical protein
VRTADLRSLALIEPLGDAGIGTYTHELAEALVGAGIRADVYATESAWSRSLPRRHRLYPVIGSALFHQRDILDGPGRALADPPQAPAVGSAGAMPDSPSLLGEAAAPRAARFSRSSSRSGCAAAATTRCGPSGPRSARAFPTSGGAAGGSACA